MSKSTEVSTPAPRKSRSSKRHPTQEEIQLRAYEIYLRRNGAPGNPLEDWVQAERELLEQFSKPSKKIARMPNPKAA